jgi:hypothetical protein
MKFKEFVLAGIVGLSAYSCGKESGCQVDTDCKGERVCSAGECVGDNGGGSNDGPVKKVEINSELGLCRVIEDCGNQAVLARNLNSCISYTQDNGLLNNSNFIDCMEYIPDNCLVACDISNAGDVGGSNPRPNPNPNPEPVRDSGVSEPDRTNDPNACGRSVINGKYVARLVCDFFSFEPADSRSCSFQFKETEDRPFWAVCEYFGNTFNLYVDDHDGDSSPDEIQTFTREIDIMNITEDENPSERAIRRLESIRCMLDNNPELYIVNLENHPGWLGDYSFVFLFEDGLPFEDRDGCDVYRRSIIGDCGYRLNGE